MINRTKTLVLALFAVYWVTVVTILVAARDVYDQAARLPGGNQRPAEVGILLVLTALFALLTLQSGERAVVMSWLSLLSSGAGTDAGGHRRTWANVRRPPQTVLKTAGLGSAVFH